MVANFKEERAMKFMLVAALMLPMIATAQEPGTDLPPPAGLCDSKEYRQFDYWIGDWNLLFDGHYTKKIAD